ncbi:TauD/TfdA family dioxygenase [uncultured Tateyamaria sp.]|uniref:TauD/TfdA family dioxygenase n=1 Tax=uncultured Tateyamaria sp. TaxID=455651 RepID=UPI002635FC7A|nr:TauD/TfdA family dioxygenase [uncultured Tateyamaria sp.]
MGKHDTHFTSPSVIATDLNTDHLTVHWAHGGLSRFHYQWLRDNCRSDQRFDINTRELRSFSYQHVMNDPHTAAAMIADFQRFGLVQMIDVPTEQGEVERFAEHLAHVREIAFDRVANIRVSVDPYTLGFTKAALPLHTDCSGYSWPPNVMVFHCLQNDVAGGASQYVDGAQVVAQLRDENPEALEVLTTHDVEFRLWSGKADTLSQFPPVILNNAGELVILRYANWTVQPLRTVPFDLVPQWYDAWRALAARVNAPENRLSYRCEPGEILLINNHRVLHGRDAFDDDEGVRHFQQVYMELDDLTGYQRIVEGQGGAR